MDSFSLPAGFGFRRYTVSELQRRVDLIGTLQVFERPRTRGPRRYVLGVDVSDGVGKDRSAIAIHRIGTLEEPEEQVALYVADQTTPQALAYIVDALARVYVDADNYEGLMAIEVNNHGLSVQDTLQLHLGASNFYRWEYLDAGEAKARYSTKIGWVTTQRTRPMLLDKLYHSLTTVDPTTGQTDLLVHAQILIDELADFATETTLAEAAAARGAHDDVVMATAIAHYVAWRMQGGEQEPLSERRVRHQAEKHARLVAAGPAAPKRDYRNTGCTLEEMNAQVDEDGGDDSVYDGERGSPMFLA